MSWSTSIFTLFSFVTDKQCSSYNRLWCDNLPISYQFIFLVHSVLVAWQSIELQSDGSLWGRRVCVETCTFNFLVSADTWILTLINESIELTHFESTRSWQHSLSLLRSSTDYETTGKYCTNSLLGTTKHGLSFPVKICHYFVGSSTSRFFDYL